ncbi:flavodoxin family protein [bacterium]|nr:flavodoxin family protein [bacterium]
MSDKKVLGIAASPRKEGNSSTLLKIALDGIKDKGFETEFLFLQDYNFKPCIECNSCIKTGKCVQEDDMQKLYPKLEEAIGIIFSTPIFFYGIPGYAKCFIDRFQPYWARDYVLKEFTKYKGLGGMIGVAGSKGEMVFKSAEVTLKYFYESVGFKPFKSLVFRNVGKFGEVEVSMEMEFKAKNYGKDFTLFLRNI